MNTPGRGRLSSRVGLIVLAVSMAWQVRASESSLRDDVSMLAGTIGPRSVQHGDSLKRSADYITGRLERAGWTVRRLGYAVNGKTCENLEVERKGTSKPDEIVVIGAHYDTVFSSPGADDNASGVAALLALADELGRFAPARTLRLVAFVNEEPAYFQSDLMGSRVYARACKQRGERITAMVALDAVGFFSDKKKSQRYPFPLRWFYPSRGDFVGIVGNRESKALVKQVARAFADTASIRSIDAALPAKIAGVGWSDHWSFWQEGYAAVMITDTATFRNPHYHRATDTPETLDYARLGGVVTALRSAVEVLTNGK
jgi:Zn-dependent M28 family amino/carboxypeptidase